MSNLQSLKQKKIFKSVVLAVKIIIVALIAFVVYEMLIKDLGNQLTGISIIVLIFLPSIFEFFLKERITKDFPITVKIWQWARIVYLISFVIFIAIIAFGFYRMYDKNRTERAIEIINNTKITIIDVMGENLPPVPDKELNDSTIAGIDANNNFIRDDVELSIFEKYPNSAKIRAAALQYAQSLQLELTQVFNSKTLVRVIQKEGLAYRCLNIADKDRLDDHEKEAKDLVLNKDHRIKKYYGDLRKYMTTYSLLNDEPCDIDFSILSN